MITGASGYIGAPATRALIARGCAVHMLGRTDPAVPGTTFHAADLLDTSDIQQVVDSIGAEVLLHLAWSVPPGKFWTDPINQMWADSSVKLFRAFAKAGGNRIVGAGSCAEYDWSTSPLIEHSSPIRPSTPYGEAKARVWSELEALGAEMGLSTAWGRLFFLYGPGEPEGKLVADVATSLLDGRRVQATPGLQRRDFLYVEDAGEALAALTLSSVTGPVNIGSGEAVSVRGLLEQIEAVTGTSGLIEFGARPFAAEEPRELVADVGRLRDEVGFRPKLTLADGIACTVAWHRERRPAKACS